MEKAMKTSMFHLKTFFRLIDFFTLVEFFSLFSNLPHVTALHKQMIYKLPEVSKDKNPTFVTSILLKERNSKSYFTK